MYQHKHKTTSINYSKFEIHKKKKIIVNLRRILSKIKGLLFQGREIKPIFRSPNVPGETSTSLGLEVEGHTREGA